MALGFHGGLVVMLTLPLGIYTMWLLDCVAWCNVMPPLTLKVDAVYSFETSATEPTFTQWKYPREGSTEIVNLRF
jgi:hypothetical protein